MVWRESTMSSLVRALPSCKATRTKSVKSRLTPKATRSSRRVATRRADFGQLRPVMKFSVLERILARVTKMKYSPALSTTRAIQSSQALKITPVVSGRTSDLSAHGKKKMAAKLLQERSNDYEFSLSYLTLIMILAFQIYFLVQNNAS